MKKYKEIGFGLFVILGILLAGCNNQQDVSEKPTNINESIHSENAQVEETTDSNTEKTVKEMYEEKLRGAKEQADNLKAEDNSTYAMKDMESSRWEIWDGLLNEIYGDLKEMLSADEMRALRTEQLDWIELRDNGALEASLEYKGGTMESLVYVSVLATVTEQRCYELVENYVQ